MSLQELSQAADGLSDVEVESRVSLLQPRMILMREVPVPTPTTIRQMAARARELLGGEPMTIVIVDLRDDAGVPDAASRAQIRRELNDMDCELFGIVIDNRLWFHVAAKFIIAGLRIERAQVFKSVEEAQDTLGNA